MASLRFCQVMVLFVAMGFCFGDISLHNPRGNNNRLNEQSRDRTTATRVFDSQNNARGGYNLGVEPMYFYEGSNLEIQWAVQHTCGDQNNNCEIVIQYMCDDNIRAGKSTTVSPSTRNGCKDYNCHTTGHYGINENYHYFEKCASRERNKGLYTADQQPSATSRGTRQNPAGTKFGYECPEEKDYYPYWGPSPWKDIVVFTNDVERCDYYRNETQNVKGRYECVINDEAYWLARGNSLHLVLFQTKAKCEQSKITIRGVEYRGKWVYVEPHGIKAPECRPGPWSRDNHQGNTIGGQFLKYDWVVPKLEDEEATCVLRIRYNISTNDYDSWDTFSNDNEVPKVPVTQFSMKPDDIYTPHGFTKEEARQRGYYLRNNPNIFVFPNATTKKKQPFLLQIAVNTAQYGRTFQDRTHPFSIKHRPKAIRDKVIHNVNVRGKRGNLQQVYPATEYDFVPNKLYATEGEMIHFQWTGADTNPPANAGQGLVRTDRSNAVALIDRKFLVGPGPWSEANNNTLRTNYPSKSLDMLGFSWKSTESLGFLERCGGYDPLLDKKSAYFDLGPQLIFQRGSFYYMSTRNNQFTNRNQKASIIVGQAFFLGDSDGEKYRGHKKRTYSGIECQRWDSQYPHKHKFSPEDHPDDDLESNFCRNPGTVAHDEGDPWCFTGPWCYTTDPDVLWQYCGIESETDKERRERLEDEEFLEEAIARLNGNVDVDYLVDEEH